MGSEGLRSRRDWKGGEGMNYKDYGKETCLDCQAQRACEIHGMDPFKVMIRMERESATQAERLRCAKILEENPTLATWDLLLRIRSGK
jgi:hypothetical protein